jgi:hypothetical protein
MCVMKMPTVLAFLFFTILRQKKKKDLLNIKQRVQGLYENINSMI